MKQDTFDKIGMIVFFAILFGIPEFIVDLIF